MFLILIHHTIIFRYSLLLIIIVTGKLGLMFKLFPLKRERGWRTFKRPGVDAFLEHLAKFYEIVVYSDQLSMVIMIFLFSFLFPETRNLLIRLIYHFCHIGSMLILSSKGWIRKVVFVIGWREMQPDI